MRPSALLVFFYCVLVLGSSANAQEAPLRERNHFGPRPDYDRSGNELVGQVDCFNYLGVWGSARGGLIPRLSDLERENYALLLARVRAERIAHLESVLPGVFRGRFVKQGEKTFFVSYRRAAIQALPGQTTSSFSYGLIAEVFAEPGSGLEQAQNEPGREFEITGSVSVQHADHCIESNITINIQGTIRATAIRPL